MAQSRRDHLVDIALQIFNQYGFHATGIDKILKEAGVSKKTLYKYFKSKDELIVAVLEERDEQLMKLFRENIGTRAHKKYQNQAESKIFALFDFLFDWFQSNHFYGCNFINACAEYTEQENIIHQVASKHKIRVQGFITELVGELEVADPKLLVFQICLLTEGAIVLAHTTGNHDAAKMAKMTVKQLLDKH